MCVCVCACVLNILFCSHAQMKSHTCLVGLIPSSYSVPNSDNLHNEEGQGDGEGDITRRGKGMVRET